MGQKQERMGGGFLDKWSGSVEEMERFCGGCAWLCRGNGTVRAQWYIFASERRVVRRMNQSVDFYLFA